MQHDPVVHKSAIESWEYNLKSIKLQERKAYLTTIDATFIARSQTNCTFKVRFPVTH